METTQASLDHLTWENPMGEARKDALSGNPWPNPAVAFFDNTCEAGMMCGTAENRAEGMEGNGGGLPKWCEKADS